MRIIRNFIDFIKDMSVLEKIGFALSILLCVLMIMLVVMVIISQQVPANSKFWIFMNTFNCLRILHI